MKMEILSGNALVTGAGSTNRQPNSCQNHSHCAGSGIGRQLSLAYVRAGIRGIALADLNKDGIDETARLIQDGHPDTRILPLVVDVTDEESVNAMVDSVVQTFGTLDCGKSWLCAFVSAMFCIAEIVHCSSKRGRSYCQISRKDGTCSEW